MAFKKTLNFFIRTALKFSVLLALNEGHVDIIFVQTFHKTLQWQLIIVFSFKHASCRCIVEPCNGIIHLDEIYFFCFYFYVAISYS